MAGDTYSYVSVWFSSSVGNDGKWWGILGNGVQWWGIAGNCEKCWGMMGNGGNGGEWW